MSASVASEFLDRVRQVRDLIAENADHPEKRTEHVADEVNVSALGLLLEVAEWLIQGRDELLAVHVPDATAVDARKVVEALKRYGARSAS